MTFSVPELSTPRLLLRAPRPSDIPRIAQLANDRELAGNTLHMPYPYSEADAEAFVLGAAAQDTTLVRRFAQADRKTDELIGMIGLHLTPAHGHAELGYWVGRPFWGQGLCTEAVAAVVRYGFDIVGLRRIFAQHFANNPASGRVLQKVGFVREGELRAHYVRFGEVKDVVLYGLLREGARAT